MISSEVYLDNAFDQGCLPAAACGPNMVSIGSLTKVHGLGGIRVGWIVAPDRILRRARQALDYLECNLPAPSESIALAAMRRAPDLARRPRMIAARNLAAVREWICGRDDVR